MVRYVIYVIWGSLLAIYPSSLPTALLTLAPPALFNSDPVGVRVAQTLCFPRFMAWPPTPLEVFGLLCKNMCSRCSLAHTCSHDHGFSRADWPLGTRVFQSICFYNGFGVCTFKNHYKPQLKLKFVRAEWHFWASRCVSVVFPKNALKAKRKSKVAH